MKRAIIAAVAFALLLITPARSEEDPYGKVQMFSSGDWHVVLMRRNANGNPMCFLNTWIQEGGSTAHFAIKFTVANGMFVEVSKTGWDFGTGIDILFYVALDQGLRPMMGRSRAPYQQWPSTISAATLDADEREGLLRDIASATAGTIRFDTGNEPSWTMGMRSASEAVSWFRSCMKAIQEKTG